MTAFTTNAAWGPDHNNDKGIYCAQADTTYLEFKYNAVDPQKPAWSSGPANNNLQWTIMIYGHDPAELQGHGNAKTYGLQLTNQGSHCTSGEVELSVIGKGTFYGYPLSSDTTQNNHSSGLSLEVTDPGCPRMYADFCERMAVVDISISAGGVQSPQEQVCKDGDCTVGIGSHP